MLIIPAVDIKNGKCVQLVQGKPGTEQIVIENPEIVAEDWENKGAEILHVINLDGAFGNSSKNLDVVKKILNTVSIPVQLGGGIRTIEDAENLLNIGIEKVILGTMAVESPEKVEKLTNEYGSNRTIVALDSKEGNVVVKGWTEKTEKSAPELGVDTTKKRCRRDTIYKCRCRRSHERIQYKSTFRIIKSCRYSCYLLWWSYISKRY